MREPVYAAFRRVVEPQPGKILILPTEEEMELTYQKFCGSLEEALACVSDENCSSVQVEFGENLPILAGLYRPHFAGSSLADWSASAEGLRSSAEAIFKDLQRVEGLGYIALFSEESADLIVDHVTEETFPWSDWHLIAGAVRATNGEWIVRHRTVK